MEGGGLSVQEAARRMGVEPMTVRRHIAAGSLVAVKNGRDWSVEARSLERLVRQRPGLGRALEPGMAWAVLLLASGDEASARQAAGQPRYFSRAREWLRERSLVEHADRLRARAVVEEFDAHPSEVARVLGRPDVLPTGISAGAAVGLVGGPPEAEVYAPVALRSVLVDGHALVAGPGPVTVRWVWDELWPSLDPDDHGRAPEKAVQLDLLEHDDPRARRVAAEALRS